MSRHGNSPLLWVLRHVANRTGRILPTSGVVKTLCFVALESGLRSRRLSFCCPSGLSTGCETSLGAGLALADTAEPRA